MDTAEIHSSEYERALSRFQEQQKHANRMAIFRTVLLAIAVLFFASYVAQIEEIRLLRNSLGADLAEYDYTVSAYLAAHRAIEHEVYVPDEKAQALMRLIAKLKTFLGEDLTLENQSGRLLRDVLDQARKKPEHIRVENSYLQNLSIPVSYTAMSLTVFYLALISFFYSSFRQQELQQLLHYAHHNFRSARAPSATKAANWQNEPWMKPDAKLFLSVGEGASPYRVMNNLAALALFAYLANLAAHITLAEADRPTAFFYRVLMIIILVSIPTTLLVAVDRWYSRRRLTQIDGLLVDEEDF